MLRDDRDAVIASTPTPDIKRKRALGIYYTPSDVAEILAEWGVRKATDVVLEPSFGGCSMLSAAVTRLRKIGSKQPDEQLLGYDIDRHAFSYLKNLNLKRTSGRFHNLDFLKASAKPLCSVVLGNPPYVGYHRMRASQRRAVETWRKEQRAQFSKQASLWAYFVVHSLGFLRPGGRLAFIVPPTITTADYAKPIVKKLADVFERVRIVHITEQLFETEGANERCAVLLADGFGKGRPVPARIECDSAASLTELRACALDLAQDTHPDAPIAGATAILDRLAASGIIRPLGEIASVTIGEVVGDVSFFVKAKADWKRLGVSGKYLRPIVTRTKQLPGLVCGDGDRRGMPRLLRVTNKQAAPAKVQKYLSAYPQKKRQANRTFGKREPWYTVPYGNRAAAFIASLSQNAPRVVMNRCGIACTNGFYRLAPLRGRVFTSAMAAGSLSTLTQLSAELNARVRGPGALKLEPSDVRKLLLPVKAGKYAAVTRRVDALLRAGKWMDAVSLVDRNWLRVPKVLTEEELSVLVAATALLRRRRLRQPA